MQDEPEPGSLPGACDGWVCDTFGDHPALTGAGTAVAEAAPLNVGGGAAPGVPADIPVITTTETAIVYTPPASLRSMLGSPNYYIERLSDFGRRNPGAAAPDYYLGYGDKYIKRFTTVLRPGLSPSGQAWVDCTVISLQKAIEDRLDANPAAFAALELQGSAFRDFAFGCHANAYVSCGVCSLSIVDELRICMTPDFRDVITLGGLGQILDVFAQCNSEWFTPRGPSL